MLRIFFLSVFLLFESAICFAQCSRTLDDYLRAAVSNSPELKENRNLLQSNLLQADITRAQQRKPLVNITADYLFAPYFFNNGHFIAITPDPSTNAYGYDASLSNGGLYAAQLNVSYQVFNGGVYKILSMQNEIQNKSLLQKNKQLLHDLENNVNAQYISIYQIQQQIIYLENIMTLVNGRRQVIQSLVEQGIMTQNDYLLLDIEMSGLQFETVRQKIALSDALTGLNNLCGLSDTAICKLETPGLTMTIPLTRFSYQDQYILDSLDISAQQQLSSSKFKPQVDVFGNTGLNSSWAPDIPHNLGLSAGIHLSVPLYDGHQKDLTERQSRLSAQSLQAFLSDKEIRQKNNFNALVKQINNARISIKYIDNQLATQEQLLKMIKDKVAAGQVSVTDYLVAVRDFAEANQNKIQAQTQLWQLINQYNYINW